MKIYSNGSEVVKVDSENRFIYEVCVYLRYDNIVAMIDHKYYAVAKKINHIESYFVTNYLEFYTVLYSAPEKWLIDNGYLEYEYPKKRINKKKNEQKINSNK